MGIKIQKKSNAGCCDANLKIIFSMCVCVCVCGGGGGCVCVCWWGQRWWGCFKSPPLKFSEEPIARHNKCMLQISKKRNNKLRLNMGHCTNKHFGFTTVHFGTIIRAYIPH